MEKQNSARNFYLYDRFQASSASCKSCNEQRALSIVIRGESNDYLLDLPIKSLTLKNAQKHEKDFEDLKQKITEIEKMTPKDMWITELNNLKV